MLRDGWWRVWRVAITGATVALVLAVGLFVTVGIPKLSAHANARSPAPDAHPSSSAGTAPNPSPPPPPPPSPPPPSPPPVARTTAAGTVWLCRPGLSGNPCAADLAAISVSASGARTPLAASPAAATGFDCFYAYPTVSLQSGANANLNVDPPETAIAISQASRFSQVCNVWAPIYAQRTKVDQPPGFDPNAAAEVAYESLRSAWRDYLANFNGGRPVVMIGHSQGAIVLARLIGAEVDPNPAVRRLVVSALLIGGNVGGFPNMPGCRSPGQTGCVIAYSSYYEEPPPDSIFGRLGGLCANPASLGGGAGTLQPFQRVANAWVTYPGLYAASCVSAEGATWLEVTPAPGDPRPRIPESLGPAWGLHENDVNLALGNLVADVAAEEAAYH